MGHIATVESRLVRGDLLDASVWSKRNITIRALQLVGGLAAGYQFSIKEKGILKGIGAFNGQVVPGAETFWPDSSIAQANRISDFGFQVNKMVAQQSAELIVAFYPVSRFLTPGLQAIFRKAPALLFAPTSAAFDNNAFNLLQRYAPDTLSTDERGKLQEYLKDPKDPKYATVEGCRLSEGCRLNGFLNSFSLNHVRVVVGGIMTVDVATIAPAIEEIAMDGGNTAATWAEAGTKTGTVSGEYLAGSDVTILNAATYGITGAAAVPTGSTDTALKIQFTLSKPLAADTVLTVTLTKKTTVDGQDKTLTSNPYLLKVAYNPPQPKITAVTADTGKVTITGSDLYDVNATLAVSLHPSVATGLKDVAVPKDAITAKATEIDIDLTKITSLDPKGTLQPACWTPNVSISGVPVPGASAFAQTPKPTVTAATVTAPSATAATPTAATATAATGKTGTQAQPAKPGSTKTTATAETGKTGTQAQPAKPTSTKATATPAAGKTGTLVVEVTGTEFLDLPACNTRLVFQVQNGNAAAQPVEHLVINKSATTATFDNSPDMSSGKWKVNVLVDGKQQATFAITKAAAAPKAPNK